MSTNILNQLGSMFGLSRSLVASGDEVSLANLKVAREDLRPKEEMIKGDNRLPDYYNVRQEYPECHPKILNQNMCGACWAFASSGVLSDRFCMHSRG